MALEAVQAQAGHASIGSTRIYLHLHGRELAGRPVPQGRRGPRRAGLRRPLHRPPHESGGCVMTRPQLLPTWSQLGVRPQITDPMRRYLEQIGAVLRPGSVGGRRPRAALLRGFPGTDRTAGHQPDAGHPPTRGGLQAMAGEPPGAEQGPADSRHDRAPPGLLPDQHRVPTHTPGPTRRRRRQAPERTGRAVRPAAAPHRPGCLMTVLRSVPVAVNARRPAAGVKAELAHPKGMALTPARTGASSKRRETEDPAAADHRHNADVRSCR